MHRPVATWLVLLLAGCAGTPEAAPTAARPAPADSTVHVLTVEVAPDPATVAADARPLPHDPEQRLAETPLRWEDGDRSARSLLAWNDAWTTSEEARLREALLARLARHGPEDAVGWAFLDEHLARLADLEGVVAVVARAWAEGRPGAYPRVSVRRARRDDAGAVRLWDVGEHASAPYALLLLTLDLQVERGRRSAADAEPVIAACVSRCEGRGRYMNDADSVLRALTGDLLPSDAEAVEGEHPAARACRALEAAGLLTAEQTAPLLATPPALEETW